MRAYKEAAGIGSGGKHPLGRTARAGRTRSLLTACNHTFRATGITACLENDGTKMDTQAVAAA